MLRAVFATLFWCAAAFAAFVEVPRYEITIGVALACILLYLWLVAPLWRAGKKLLVIAITLPLVLLHLETLQKLARALQAWFA